MAAHVEAIKKRPAAIRQAWKDLGAHHKKIRDVHLRQLFAKDPQRGEHFTIEAVEVYLDYSKNRITAETLPLLIRLAEESRFRERIDAMFRGDKINVTEKRAVLHTALPRAPRCIRCCGWQERSTRSPCCARSDGRFRYTAAKRRVEGPHGQVYS